MALTILATYLDRYLADAMQCIVLRRVLPPPLPVRHPPSSSLVSIVFWAESVPSAPTSVVRSLVDALFNQPSQTLYQLKFVHVLLPNALIAVLVREQPIPA